MNKLFEKNEGRNDRIIRAVLGFIFLYLGFAFNYWLLVISAILLITAITGHCTLYTLLKFNTLGKKK